MALRHFIIFALGHLPLFSAETPARWGGWPGPVTGELKIPTSEARAVPLVTAGSADARDVIAIRVMATGRVRFSFSHAGQRVVESDEIELSAARLHRLVVSIGSLLPPMRSELYWQRPHLLHLAHHLVVIVDGRAVLAGPAEFVSNREAKAVFDENFLTKITAASEDELGSVVLPLMMRRVVREATWQGFPGPVRFVVRANNPAALGRQPLLSTGRLGAGDLIYWSVQADGRARIGFVHAGSAAIESDPLPLRAGAQELVISADGLWPVPSDELVRREPDLVRLRGSLFVELNGRVAISERVEFHPSRAENITLGADVVDSHPVQRYFDGAGESLTPLPPAEVLAAAARVVDRTGAPSDAWEGWPGPIKLRIKFPVNRIGVVEPLLCTGERGAADLLNVRYVDARHVQLSFDHWGVGGPTSESLEVDPELTQEIMVSFGALFPPAGHRLFAEQPALTQRRDELRVMLNGKTALTGVAQAHPSAPAKILFGQNPVGASSSVPVFSGTLIGIQPAPETIASPAK